MEEQNEKSLNEALNFALTSAYLQRQGVDVAYPYIAGAPGGGKTASIVDICNQYNWGFLSTHFALKPMEETGGIPQFDKVNVQGEEVLGTIWSYPDIFMKLFEISHNHEMVVWLLDDMHLCGAVHMAMMYELLTERSLRGYHIPNNVAIILAGNHASNKAGSKTMFSAIINRITLMPVYTDFDYWHKNFAIPNGIHYGITAFLKNEQYQQFFHEEEQVDEPWASPRSWTRLSNFITNYEHWINKPMGSNDLLYLTRGHVGKSAASEFVQFYEIFKNFDIEDIFNKIDNYSLPEEPVQSYALAYASTSHMAGLEHKERKKRIRPFAKLLNKFIDDREDLGLMIIHEILNLEKILNYKNFYMDVVNELNTFDPGKTSKLIERIQNAE